MRRRRSEAAYYPLQRGRGLSSDLASAIMGIRKLDRWRGEHSSTIHRRKRVSSQTQGMGLRGSCLVIRNPDPGIG